MDITTERYHPRIDNPVFRPYEPFVSYEHLHRYRYAAAMAAGRDVLDIAAGEGYGAALLAEVARSVVGADVAPAAVEHAAAAYPAGNLRFVEAAAADLGFAADQSFDLVTSFETVEHLTPADQGRFLAEARRVLRPGGVLVISTPNRVTAGHPDGTANPYHLHEFGRAEFADYLGRQFPAVRLLAQKVYPVSYLWADAATPGPVAEYRMALGPDAVFRPADGPKEAEYFVAVCSAGELPAVPDSLLVDVSAVAFTGVPGADRHQESTLYLDTGAGFAPDRAVRAGADYGPGFSVTFAVDPAEPVRALRWDPLENRACRVRVRGVTWDTADGRSHALDPVRLTANGTGAAGEWTFDTLDPMVFLPVAGRVTRVTVAGECDVLSPAESLAALDRAARVLAGRLADADAARHEQADALAADRDRQVAELRAAVAVAEAARDREADARTAAAAAADAARREQVAALTADRDAQVVELRRAVAGAESARRTEVAAAWAAVAELTQQGAAGSAAVAAGLAGVSAGVAAELADVKSQLAAVAGELATLRAAQAAAAEAARQAVAGVAAEVTGIAAGYRTLAGVAAALTSHERAAAAALAQAADRDQELAKLRAAAAAREAGLRAELHNVLTSKRWQAANAVRGVVYFGPNLVARLWR